MNFAEGTLWSEGGAGTNAIGTAIALDHAVQVFGPEHFSDPVQRWTCSAAPIHDPDTGAVIGVIDLTGDLRTVHPHSLAVADRDRARRRGQPPARAAGARRAPARPLRRPRRRRTARALVTPSGRAIGAVPPAGARRPARDPARRRRADAPVRRARGGRAGLPHARGLRRARRGVQPRRRHRAAARQAGFLGRDRATLRDRRPPRPSCARAWPRSSRCCARTRTG